MTKYQLGDLLKDDQYNLFGIILAINFNDKYPYTILTFDTKEIDRYHLKQDKDKSNVRKINE